ncbi:type II toxin-antitoxin system HicB family antitoxin [Cytobacillus firmus]|uniref:type II toxin-antitoxin system HicB family antitoxin n=1 Tax=Cytobacillus firmus TaxID=1399 RepID=UPI00064F2E1A|nr:type II toxin-antitoxin system HicB family antitoxin [Cytobacillus firmus]KML40619.1 pilus assembly protein HicB [Cytobacillus firmus]
MVRSRGVNYNKQHEEILKRSYSYPAVFDYADDGISVSFPDLPGVFTFGDDEDEAFRNAKEALGLHLFGMEQDEEDIPNPSKLYQVNLESNQAVALVNVFMPLIRDRVKKAAIKKTLTIPKWLNDVAEENKINFSQVLQEALKDKLGLSDSKKENHLY